MKVGLLISPSDVLDAYVSAFLEARYVHKNSIESCAPIIKKIDEWQNRCDGSFPDDGVYGCLGLYTTVVKNVTLYMGEFNEPAHYYEVLDELNQIAEPLREQIFYKTLNKTSVMSSFGFVVDQLLSVLTNEITYGGHSQDLSLDGSVETDLLLLPISVRILFDEVVSFHKIYPALDFSSIIQTKYYEFAEKRKRLCWSVPFCIFSTFTSHQYPGKSVWGVWLNAIMRKMGHDAVIDETELRGYSSSSSEPQLTIEEKMKYAKEIEEVCHQVPYL